jgi:NADH-quinone oxidoreductase subunit J
VAEQERKWLAPRQWIGPSLLCALLLAELLYLLLAQPSGAILGSDTVSAKEVGISLFGPYVLAVELAAMLLLAALVAAFHLGRPEAKEVM